ncbi:PREDICTED: uncharacterized protein LOC108975212, partial [Bactrocera latifrons]|uniref:uncharacterized protein LOC108975212 n=1 Tax=Bactrocera latifrons TaxID=174628 RepID=UPI0008DCFBE0
MNRGIFQDISRRETNTFDSNRFYEKYLFPQTAKNFPKKFQNRQSPKFLPKRQQFGRNIADHHHKLNERNRLYKNNYDYDFIAYSKYISDSKSRNIDEDEQPCSSCGGKSKKPPTKTVGNIMTRNIKCNCKGYQHECLCSSKKVPRSLYDTWYSVFNMNAPLPFLTTKLRIFHKKKNIWFQTVPSITLSSLSGTFVNTNLSILFSSHVDIIQLEKSLLIQKQRLLIPQDDMNGFQRNVSDKISGNNLDSNQISPENEKLACHPIDGQHLFLQQCPYSADSKERLNRKSLISFVKTIADLGYFPTSVNILDRCLNNSTRLCLNMLSDKVP